MQTEIESLNVQLFNTNQIILVQEKEIKQLKDKVVNRQTHINTLRQDLNKVQDKLHIKA